MTCDPPPEHDPASYQVDVFAWSQQQAAVLRAMPRVASLDAANVAEEIEGLGRNDLRAVESLLGRLVEHLVKIDAAPQSRNLQHWRDEARLFARDARIRYSPGMRQLLDIAAIWHDGVALAQEYLVDRDVLCAAPAVCPFALVDLIGVFDLDRRLADLAAARFDAP